MAADRAGEIAIPATAQWPAPIDEAAYYGLAGDIARTLEPQTEADPVAILIHVLVGVGNLARALLRYRGFHLAVLMSGLLLLVCETLAVRRYDVT
jgi:hypothetical protein